MFWYIPETFLVVFILLLVAFKVFDRDLKIPLPYVAFFAGSITVFLILFSY